MRKREGKGGEGKERKGGERRRERRERTGGREHRRYWT